MEGPGGARKIALDFAAQNLTLIQRDAPSTVDLLSRAHLSQVSVDLLKTVGAAHS